MKKVLILPYFGQFNNYFPLWLESAKNNKSIDFLIITDAKWNWGIPENFKIISISFEEFKNYVQDKFKEKVILKKPYKLCDLKPYYGYIFYEYIVEYDFWGYCDCDLVFGNIDTFLSEELFNTYDKLLRTGHLSFIRNKREINENFLSFDTYKTVLKSPAIYGYDESVFGFHNGFAGELISKGYSFFRNDELVADIDFRHFPFRVVSAPEKPCVFSYENGRIYRINKTENSFIKTEMIYIHLQKRKMNIPSKLNPNNYIIKPNEFCIYDEGLLLNDSFWDEVSKEKNNYYSKRKETIYNSKRDFMRFMYEPQKIESIRYRFLGRRRNEKKSVGSSK